MENVFNNTVYQKRVMKNRLVRPIMDWDIIETILSLANGRKDLVSLLDSASEISFLINDTKTSVKIDNVLDAIAKVN